MPHKGLQINAVDDRLVQGKTAVKSLVLGGFEVRADVGLAVFFYYSSFKQASHRANHGLKGTVPHKYLGGIPL